ncbi:hypothetical protein, unlikely [Trypanosoma brucei gambiense DAL972]|uniref:Uncharacterized protein n=1 Tax=Trypanosoma brucei gambiense (strain MHOM/CI/86/DAL972) TaxID=679716 RepID=C9ZPZ0_TRYB9|nr:hypothetical protein, unlikely [Trypanosoma brucei gambiense DAL972]CBH11468.1 hypothetical protein, unlikely [Trypanosoma brucei gambiense DAL972]|eukprot:XP_011773755.1 hypothetical protein, unlikely [Trypanosoma brucei gambiense DAL972]
MTLRPTSKRASKKKQSQKTSHIQESRVVVRNNRKYTSKPLKLLFSKKKGLKTTRITKAHTNCCGDATRNNPPPPPCGRSSCQSPSPNIWKVQQLSGGRSSTQNPLTPVEAPQEARATTHTNTQTTTFGTHASQAEAGATLTSLAFDAPNFSVAHPRACHLHTINSEGPAKQTRKATTQ